MLVNPQGIASRRIAYRLSSLYQNPMHYVFCHILNGGPTMNYNRRTPCVVNYMYVHIGVKFHNYTPFLKKTVSMVVFFYPFGLFLYPSQGFSFMSNRHPVAQTPLPFVFKKINICIIIIVD